MRRIRVLNNFGGKVTNERRILPGDYDADDEAIMGLADYLVSEGVAIEIAGIAHVNAPVVVPDNEGAVEPLKSKGGRPRKDAL
jgi:hypothetical protein